jgi:hypothetical protein
MGADEAKWSKVNPGTLAADRGSSTNKDHDPRARYASLSSTMSTAPDNHHRPLIRNARIANTRTPSPTRTHPNRSLRSTVTPTVSTGSHQTELLVYTRYAPWKHHLRSSRQQRYALAAGAVPCSPPPSRGDLERHGL